MIPTYYGQSIENMREGRDEVGHRSPMLTAQDALAGCVRPGSRGAFGDGPWAPAGLAEALSTAARRAGGVRLLLGWCLELPADLDLGAFADARTFIASNALREPVAA